jgi:hypothetical protein
VAEADFLVQLRGYRITVRGEDGRVKAREKKAANPRVAVEGQDELAKIVKVERIHPTTGEVLGGIYHE